MDKETEIEKNCTDLIWKVSITKQELAELPAARYEGDIHVIDTIEAADKAVEILKNEREIGFDTETRPSFKRGQSHNVALLQLSSHTQCFLFRLNKIGLPESVKRLLENKDILKIGVSIHDDFINLNKKYSLNPATFIDLQSFVKDYNIADNSLSRIYAILFSHRISKGQRLTNWEAPLLTNHQQEYASLDALACLHIYDYLKTGNFDYFKSKYYRAFPTEPLSKPQTSLDNE
ncbi:MAG: 3'-5' exonuclease domain-containing protein 2 [Candidatus Amulumruptor caecigallinarius]|nr:3'-5' exonuclease domain-containing protein 2 [Candidatus Amulumruptor caecigallinarius]